MTGWRSARAWAPALVAAVCLGGLLLSSLDPVSPPPEVAEPRESRLDDQARALLGGLTVGDRIMGWTVQALDGPTEGVLRIDLGRDQVRFALMVDAVGARPEPPPVRTERYAIFYGHVQPPDTALPEGTIRATTHALARRLRAHEHDVVVPGL
ncbi:MAG: hypothetical protein KDK70_01920 [Myxococcales bacterium]|nr:hypothetical protein [Myxococcales bacterium]